MKRLVDGVASLFGLVREISPTLDIIKELNAGKLVLVDSGMHNPMQRWVRNIAIWDQFLETRSFEIRTWSTAFSEYFNHDRREEFVGKDRLLRPEKVRFVGPFVRNYNPDGIDIVYDLKDVGAHAEEVHASLLSTLKTVVHFQNNWEDEVVLLEGILRQVILTSRELAARGEDLPLCMIEINSKYDTDVVRGLIHELHQVGNRVVVVRQVFRPEPTCDFKADIHIVERSPFLDYLRGDDEVLLRSGTPVLLAPFYWLPTESVWKKRNSRPRVLPSIDEYNAGRIDPFGPDVVPVVGGR